MPVTVVPLPGGQGPPRVDVSSPLAERDLAVLPGGPCVVQLSAPMRGTDHEVLGRWIAEHPEAELRVHGRLPESLCFLEHYPRLRAFSLDSASRDVTDATGLEHLPETLRSLTLDVRLPGGSLEVLSRFRELRSLRLGEVRRLPGSVAGLPVTELHLAGVRTLDGISALADVTTLRLRSVSADLAPLLALGRLTDLTLALGGCQDLTPLAELPGLRRFSARQVRGVVDLGPVVGGRLEELDVAQLRRVTALPPLARARALRRVTLEHMRGLTDLAPLAAAPALQELALIEMQHLGPGDLAPLAGHPTLTRVDVGLGSHRKNLAARDLVHVPGSYGGHPWPVPGP